MEDGGVKYTQEVELPNGHKWRKRLDGGWCRFSKKTCYPSVGQTQAQAQTPPWPEPPTGYHWRAGKNGVPKLVNNGINTGRPMDYDPLTNTFKPRSQNIVPRTANNLTGGPLVGATQTQGHFPLEGGPPNGKLFRAKNTGEITSYATYDANGIIIKRVDVDPTGAPHRGVEPPHVITYGRNSYTDKNGVTITRAQKPDTKAYPSPARIDEIP